MKSEPSTGAAWNVLVVDDEEDVHTVTRLALKRQRWRNRPIELTHAHSGEEAQRVIAGDPERFQVALVDVVMESRHAGLDLCRTLRATCPASLRIILRTGQVGLAPKEVVLEEYDIDYYLAKPEVTAERLYSVIRACLRSSQDIATLIAFSLQLRNFTQALQSVTALSDLLLFMGEGLKFLELKHSCRIQFVHDSRPIPGAADDALADSRYAAEPKVVEAARQLHGSLADPARVHPGSESGLPRSSVLLLFGGGAESSLADEDSHVPGALYAEFEEGMDTPKAVEKFAQDARFFIENWVIAYSTLRMQQHLATERMLREKMYVERVESIAHMVTGVAHEINTPLGVANTASSLIRSSLSRLQPVLPASVSSTSEDLEEACQLLERNITRAHDLIRSFKQLSASQLSDLRMKANLVDVIRDCVASLSPDLKKQDIQIKIHAPDEDLMEWEGYPGHLSQVAINLVQNAAKYGYGGKSGLIDIRLTRAEARFMLEVQDYGAGIDESVRDRIFQPFVTTGGTGLGLAIVENIVTNLLDGSIQCESSPGEGTVFAVDLPAVVPAKE